MSEKYLNTILGNGFTVSEYTGDVFETLEHIRVEKKGRKQFRRDVRENVIAKHKARHLATDKAPWWADPDEDGKFRKPHLPGKGADEHPNKQNGRWLNYRPRPLGKWIKHHYSAPDVELANYFAKIDARVEREEFRIADRADALMDLYDQTVARESAYYAEIDAELADIADALVAEWERAICVQDMLRNRYVVLDGNHPGVLYVSRCKEHAQTFADFLAEEGGAPSRVKRGWQIPLTTCCWDVCNLDLEFIPGETDNPFFFWHYEEE